jgi:hypothetical protein
LHIVIFDRKGLEGLRASFHGKHFSLFGLKVSSSWVSKIDEYLNFSLSQTSFQVALRRERECWGVFKFFLKKIEGKV